MSSDRYIEFVELSLIITASVNICSGVVLFLLVSYFELDLLKPGSGWSKYPVLVKDILWWCLPILFYTIILIKTSSKHNPSWETNYYGHLAMVVVAVDWLCIKLIATLYFSLGYVVHYRNRNCMLIRIISIVPRLFEALVITTIYSSYLSEASELNSSDFLDIDLLSMIAGPLSVYVNIVFISWWHRERKYLDDNHSYIDTIVAGYYYNPEGGYKPGEKRIDRNNVMYLWLTPILTVGYTRPLTLQDLNSLPIHMTSEYTRRTFLLALKRLRYSSDLKPNKDCNYDYVKVSTNDIDFDNNNSNMTTTESVTWIENNNNNDSNNNNNSSNSIDHAMNEFIYVFLKVHGLKFLKVGIIKFCVSILSFLGPILLGAMVNYIDTYHGSTSIYTIFYGLLLVFLLGCSFILSAVLNACYSFRCTVLQCKMSGMLMRLVYHRAMSLPSYAWSEDLNLSHDQVTTLIQVDISHIANICQSVHDLWTLPLEVIGAFLLLYFQVKEAFFAGVVIILIVIPINTYIAKRIGYATKGMLSQKDKRVQILSEAVYHMKGVKLMGWEEVILSLASLYRSKEIKYLSQRKYLDAICVFLWATMPVFVPFATFVTSMSLGVKLTAAKVFTTVALLNLLIFPMNAFPWVVNSFVEARVSFKRIITLCAGRKKKNSDSNSASNSSSINHGHNDSIDISSNHKSNDDHSSDNRKRKLNKNMGSNSNSNSNQKGKIEMDRKVVYENTIQLDFGYNLNEVVAWNTEQRNSSIKTTNSIYKNMMLVTNKFDNMKNRLLLKVENMIWIRKTSHLSLANNIDGNNHDDSNNNSNNHISNPLRTSDLMKEDFEIGPISLEIYSGQLIGITGAVASGKSSILLGIINEIRRQNQLPSNNNNSGNNSNTTKTSTITFIEDGLQNGSVSYCPQIPTLHGNVSIRDNILMGSEYDEMKYKRIITGCGLLQDFEEGSFSSGDKTLMKPGYSNLSGGQRLRVGIARALYSSSDLILLDDPFSALDKNTAVQLRDCLVKEVYEYNRSILLATHHVQLLEQCHTIISLKHGKEVYRGDYNQYLHYINNRDSNNQRDSYIDKISTNTKTIPTTLFSSFPVDLIGSHEDKLSETMDVCDNIIEKDTILNPSIENKGQVVFTDHNNDDDDDDDDDDLEARKSGNIATSVYYRYIQSMGLFIVFLTILSTALMQCSINGMAYWLAYWVSHQSSFNFQSFLYISTFIVCLNILFTAMRSYFFAYGTLSASKKLHQSLIQSILSSALEFFEITSIGRIVNRIGRDTNVVDDDLPFMLNIVLAQVFLLFGSIIVIIYTDPLVLIVLCIVSYLYYYLQRFYRTSSRELRRLDSIYRSPIYSMLHDCLQDGICIRAMNKLQYFENKFETALDKSLQVSRIVNLSSQWLSIRLQLLGAIVAMSLALSSVLCSAYEILPVSGALLGLSLTYSLTLVSNLNGLIGSLTETEKEMISVERVMEYIDLPSEYSQEKKKKEDNDNENSSNRDESSDDGDNQEDKDRVFDDDIYENDFHYIDIEGQENTKNIKSNHSKGLYRPLISFPFKQRQSSPRNKNNHTKYDKNKKLEKKNPRHRSNNYDNNSNILHSIPWLLDPSELPSNRNSISSESRQSNLLWPLTGEIVISDLSMTYHGCTIPSLRGINITISSGSRVAIVGRTGSGKSSLLRAILHIDSYEGMILIDNMEVRDMPKKFLRSHMSMISQDPVLFTASVRFNVDPYSNYSDDEIANVLELVGLKSSLLQLRQLQQSKLYHGRSFGQPNSDSNPNAITSPMRTSVDIRENQIQGKVSMDLGKEPQIRSKSFDSIQTTLHMTHPFSLTEDSMISINDMNLSITHHSQDMMNETTQIERDEKKELLDMLIEDAGKNLSQGQKQLLCLARALLKPSRLILVDEATAAIDSHTEAIVYECLALKAKEWNATVLCICHKLQGVKILCNYVMEMKDGMIISYKPLES